MSAVQLHPGQSAVALVAVANRADPHLVAAQAAAQALGSVAPVAYMGQITGNRAYGSAEVCPILVSGPRQRSAGDRDGWQRVATEAEQAAGGRDWYSAIVVNPTDRPRPLATMAAPGVVLARWGTPQASSFPVAEWGTPEKFLAQLADHGDAEAVAALKYLPPIAAMRALESVYTAAGETILAVGEGNVATLRAVTGMVKQGAEAIGQASSYIKPILVGAAVLAGVWALAQLGGLARGR